MIRNKGMTAMVIAAIVIAMLFSIFLMSGKLSLNGAAGGDRYKDELFDTTYVHTINIDVDESSWQDMLDNAQSEEYISCDITIDGSTVKNVGIRPKGNTSLTNVKSMDSERYSFKVKFDKYEDGGNYKGLDKLALNNIIQDNTYMKDYFSYRMMNEIGALAPLCSFTYISVNGNEWGLYLAVEGIDSSFAKRNFGNDYGEIYKPESMAMGGGKGDKDRKNGDKMQPPEMPDGFPEDMPDGFPENMPDGFPGNPPDTQGDAPNMQGDAPNMQGENKFGGGPGGGGPGGMGGDSVALVYQDDSIDSYSAIFDYSVFTPSESDKKRLISSIYTLNNGDDSELENVIDTEEVLRYFIAHNFTVNFDSYTGNMKHNYYLHEKDGKMSMIAWDYNLAFGGFGGGMGGPGGGHGENNETTVDSATQYVNYPIDTPLSGASLDERPMIGRLLNNDTYMSRYHEIFDEFLSNYFESGKFEDEYNYVFNMIDEYVKKDPTKFCTYDEFLKGSETLKNFCLLRCESIRGQIDGTIPSTSDGQSADSSSLIDASMISINDMGNMGMGGGHDKDRKNNNRPSGKDTNQKDGGMPQNGHRQNK